MNWYRIKFVIVSFLLLPCIYFTNHKITIGVMLRSLNITPELIEKIPNINNMFSYLAYILLILVICVSMTCKFKKLSNKEDLKMDKITKVYPASENFIPTFFAYILV